MPWFKVDDQLYSHPKWLAAPAPARALWVTAGSWSAAQLTDGLVPRHVLPLLGGTPRAAQALVDAGLWLTEGDGWRFASLGTVMAGERRPLRDDLRFRVYERDGGICQLCGHPDPVEWTDLHIDHVWPRSRGGSDDPSNLQTAHARCNMRKGARV